MSAYQEREPGKRHFGTNPIKNWFEQMSASDQAQLVRLAKRGTEQKDARKADDSPWTWPIDLGKYDRTAELTPIEDEMLERYADSYARDRHGLTMDFGGTLDRLVSPLSDVLNYTGIRTDFRKYVLLFFLREMASRRRSFWGWTADEWIETIERQKQVEYQHVIAVAYLVCGFADLHRLSKHHIVYVVLARKIFGRDYMRVVGARVQSLLHEWGYMRRGTAAMVLRTIFEALLYKRSPHLHALTVEDLEAVVARHPPRNGNYCVVALSRVLASMGAVPQALEIRRSIQDKKLSPALTVGVPVEWCRFSRLWFDRSTYDVRVRNKSYYFLLNVGRWLGKIHPEVLSPADWNRDLVAEAVSVICQWHAGDWCSVGPNHVKNCGRILAPATRAGRISVLRVFFRDLQEWGLIPRRFDPMRSMVTPKSLIALIGPNPRVIADDFWAKLVWAGLNLTADDLPKIGARAESTAYPLELCRALVITWLFAGLRSNEIVRLRVGCVRWQSKDVLVPGADDILPADAVCLLDVPVNKTKTAFTKPVDRIVGESIAAWERVRPQGIKLTDQKTGELVDFLFLVRLTRVGINYLNGTLIPCLCKKAGVPFADVRGKITSHRARSTIASQLYNAREPMTLFELQQWLGHATPSATQHYAKINPLKVAKSYADAGYFGRNLRAIEVLVDQDSVRSGRAASQPWKFYDLGHGYCTYDFFDQCPHRMACAKCAFYRPKESSSALLLEGKNNLLRLLQEIPLVEAEQAAIEDDVAAYESLLC